MATKKLTMNNELQSKTCCVVDNGLFFPVAQRLARDFGRVLYWTPSYDAFPKVEKCSIGDGFEDVERIQDMWEAKKETDLFVFPDIGFSAIQEELERQGKPVWGARSGDQLEILRGKFMQTVKDVGLEVAPFKAIKGMVALRHHLSDLEDKWIKVSRYRGDWETMHWRNWEQDSLLLSYKAARLGPCGELMTFYVFDNIDTEIEDGIDTFCIDGRYPETCLHGMERKDAGYICSVAKMSELPEELTHVNEAFAPVLNDYGYRGFFSTEVRITADKKCYFIDPTCRAGSPPSQIQTEMFSNYSEIIWAGANGEVVEPVPTAEFGAQVKVECGGACGGEMGLWFEVEVPEDLQEWLKSTNCMEHDGKRCFPPDDPNRNYRNWLCATGDTLKEVVETMLERIKELPDGLTANPYSLAELLKEIHAAEEQGMEFTDQKVPEPQSAIE